MRFQSFKENKPRSAFNVKETLAHFLRIFDLSIFH